MIPILPKTDIDLLRSGRYEKVVHISADFDKNVKEVVLLSMCAEKRSTNSREQAKICPALGHTRNSCFPSQHASLLGRASRKKFISYFIKFDAFGTAINCFSVKADPFCPLF